MSIGLPQILIILLLVLVVFGAGKLPKVMGDMGKGMKNFKDGLNGQDNSGRDNNLTEREAKTTRSDPPGLDDLTDARKKDSENSKTNV